MSIIFLDTETTDLNDKSRLVQLAFKIPSIGREVNEYFKPPVPISFGSMAVHHITNEHVANRPAFENSEIKKEIEELLKDNILVAHNAQFDIQILKNEGVETKQYIDTLQVSRHLFTAEQYRLQYLRYFLDLKVGPAEAHDAWGDIVVLEVLFKYLQEEIKKQFNLETEDEILTKMLELTQMRILLDKIGFGKYKDRSFKEISDIDQGYLQWLYNSETMKSEIEQNHDLVYTLKHYLNI